MRSPRGTALADYESQVASLNGQIASFEQRSKSLIRYRIATAFPGLALIVAGIAEPALGSWTWQLGLVLIAAFLFFATWYETCQWQIEKLRSQLFGVERLVHRCRRDWNQLGPLQADDHATPFMNDWTRDLDIFGDRSLFRWASLAMTRTGVETLARWLTDWAPAGEVHARQKGVQELAAARQWRMEFYQIACGLRDQRTYPEAIVEWSESPDHFHNRPILYGITWLGPILALGGSLLLILSLIFSFPIGQGIGLGAALIGFGINFLLTMLVIGPIHNLFNAIGHANRELQLLSDWVTSVQKMPHESSVLQEIHNTLLSNRNQIPDANHGIAKLQRWMSMAGLQKSPLFFIPYVILQITFLWDVRILKGLERWKHEFQPSAGPWVKVLGELEALTSAATIADEYPDWVFPELTDRGGLENREGILLGESIAHPLLREEQRVSNDLTIQESQRLLLVTGSNMAGKSTMLRSVGMNAVLGRLGAPVCALKWVSESLDIASSIRVQDSLQDGVSFFMAELKRLRGVVDQAAAQNASGGHRMLVLLDEILQGTNSRERQIAVDTVLKRLVELGCIVMASTHDLELASSDQMTRFAQIVHFREYFDQVDGKEVMRFDYKMRPGVTPTTNALKLLELVGL